MSTSESWPWPTRRSWTTAGEQDETRFDETRLAYSGAEEGDGGVDVQELEEAGAQLDDPEREAPRKDL